MQIYFLLDGILCLLPLHNKVALQLIVIFVSVAPKELLKHALLSSSEYNLLLLVSRLLIPG